MAPPGCPVHKRQRCLLSGSVGGDEGECPVHKRRRCMPPNSSEQIPQDNVDHFSRSDYLELMDLVNRPSSSSSSSCLTMLSDDDDNSFSTSDYFELLDLVNPLSSSSSSSLITMLSNDDVFSIGDVLELMDLAPSSSSPSSSENVEEEEVQSKPSTPAISGQISRLHPRYFACWKAMPCLR